MAILPPTEKQGEPAQLGGWPKDIARRRSQMGSVRKRGKREPVIECTLVDSESETAYNTQATPTSRSRRAAMRRRFQTGSFLVERLRGHPKPAIQGHLQSGHAEGMDCGRKLGCGKAGSGAVL